MTTLLKDIILISFYNVKYLYYHLCRTAALGDVLSIHVYLFALDERYIIRLWLKLGCATPGCGRWLLPNSS